MTGMTLERIAQAVEGRLVYPGGFAEGRLCEAADVVIDSRKAGPGTVFAAIRGERSDGHDYIGQVFEKGALGVICERLPEDMPGPCIAVDDTLKALRLLARYYREQMKDVKIVGIVGSVGKTSTKELVASVLEQKFNTLKTEGNFNNEIGVPLTIFRLRNEHEAAVVEMGINHFGEMDRLGDIVKPDAVVFTNVGPCHLEFLQDLDGVLRAKSEVFKHIRNGGTLILNAEDAKLNTVKEAEGLKIVRYGKGGDVFARDVKNLGLKGSEAEICFTGKDGAEHSFKAEVKLPGAHMVANSLAATAAGLMFGMDTDSIAAGIAAAQPMSGRSRLIDTGKLLVLDDCYNANPKADCAAVDLMESASGRKVAILGDMFELGEDAPALHAQVGSYAASHGIDLLVCVGDLSKNMYEAALKEGSGCEVIRFETLDELLENIDGLGLTEGDTVLVKASHGMNFAKLVERLTR
ncbi:MAG: UDP-N-acetylmuramoyl-tripeptide--D-alanyl-D-alanine ligase [Lachnospiraceae bacterium]|nr:UDP-N-acetylmuramoyl-tripeptide--D-alanyl-D-alanine ligase [Lachnospiraceae bacterium]